jgi:hypothetical protein
VTVETLLPAASPPDPIFGDGEPEATYLLRVADLLERSVDWIREWGWQQNEYENRETGRTCALGALQRANRHGVARLEMLAAAAVVQTLGLERLVEGVPACGSWDEALLATWNDGDDRVEAEVVDGMLLAASALRGGFHEGLIEATMAKVRTHNGCWSTELVSA